MRGKNQWLILCISCHFSGDTLDNKENEYGPYLKIPKIDTGSDPQQWLNNTSSHFINSRVCTIHIMDSKLKKIPVNEACD